jgi:hypothetical protein
MSIFIIIRMSGRKKRQKSTIFSNGWSIKGTNLYKFQVQSTLRPVQKASLCDMHSSYRVVGF